MIKAALNELSATKADTTNFVLDGFVNKAAVAAVAFMYFVVILKMKHLLTKK